MKRLAVQDANILIDLWIMELLELAFQLDLEMYTTDFVLAEIQRKDHQDVLQQLITEGSLTVKRFSATALSELVAFHAGQGKLSLPDCSVWLIAKKLNALFCATFLAQKPLHHAAHPTPQHG